jgi:hypothetical protein
MHLHRIVAQILLILSILNSVLAAPVVRVREIPGTRGAVAVRVPAEGVVSVLVKRPETSAGPSPGQPEPHSTTSPEHSGPLTTTNPEHPGPHSTRPPESAEIFHDALPEPEEVYHDALPEPEEVYHDALPEPEEVYHDALPEPEEVYHDAPSEFRPPATPSNAAWRQKILTPEKIKALKGVGIAGFATLIYIGLLLPPLTNRGDKDR